jgi:hypothetical protein
LSIGQLVRAYLGPDVMKVLSLCKFRAVLTQTCGPSFTDKFHFPIMEKLVKEQVFFSFTHLFGTENFL